MSDYSEEDNQTGRMPERRERFQFDGKTSPLLSLIVVAKKAEQNQAKNTKQS